MNEPEVVSRTHAFLSRWRLEDKPFAHLFTDPHPTLTSIASLKPFQRFRIEYAGLTLHPDLVCHQSASQSLIAVEAKGEGDLLQGLSQAEAYLSAVQRSFLAIPAERVTEALVGSAQARGVGVIAVDQQVKPMWVPPARRPLNKAYLSLLEDIEGAAWVNESGTYQFNLPTHYLAWALLLPIEGGANFQAIEPMLSRYPMPANWRAALSGAAKLGLVVLDGKDVFLTEAGRAIRQLMPATVEEWADVHRQLVQPRSGLTLQMVHPASAAGLRLLLLQDPIVRLVVRGLRKLGEQGGSFDVLARICSAIDPRRAAIFFLKPEAAANRVSASGKADWANVTASEYRSTTFFQYKSILKHAGVIAPTTLGGATASRYVPAHDLWVAA